MTIPVVWINAQNVFSETFDSAISDDWTIIDADNDRKIFYSPSVYAIQGQTKVACFTKCSNDYLITPKLTVTNDHHTFSFQAAGKSEYSLFTIDLMISETTPEVSSFSSVKVFEKVKVASWEAGQQEVDLSSYIGKNVYLAFHVTYISSAYSDYGIDNVTGLERWTDPEAHIKMKDPKFALGSIGKPTTANLTVKNTGAKEMKLTGVSVEAPFSCNFSPVTIAPGAETQLEVSFNPSMTGKYTSTLTLTGEGVINGTNTVTLSAMACSSSALYEDFEGAKFPPVGWSVVKDDPTLETKKSWNLITSNVYGGANCAGLMYGQIAGRLIAPKLKINEGDKMYFFLKFRTVAEVKVQYSKDGIRWTDLLVSTTNDDTYREHEIDLSPAAGESYIAFYSTNYYCFVDNISLPGPAEDPVPPVAVSNPFPNDGRTNVYIHPKLTWDKVPNAKGYLLSVGTNAEATDILNAVDVKNVNSYVVNNLPYNTKLFWKVVPYNDYGNTASVTTWSFTTYPEVLLTSDNGLPYHQGFEGGVFPPSGWCFTDDNWKLIKNDANTGDYAAWVKGQHAGESILYSPKVLIPEGYQLEYFWVRNRNGQVVDASKSSAVDTLFFEISKDNALTWQILDTLEANQVTFYDSLYHNLSKFKGETLSFRWRHKSLDDMSTLPSVIDDITLAPIPAEPKFWASVSGWYAGYVDPSESVISKAIELKNTMGGMLELVINEPTNSAFTTNLECGKTITLAPREKVLLYITYMSTDLVDDKANLAITSNGGNINLALEGYVIQPGGMGGDFENVKDFSLDLSPWTTIDVDKSGTYGFGSAFFPGYGQPMSFMALNPERCLPGPVPQLTPRSGKKVGACYGAEMPEYNGTGPNNDWLISPKRKVEEGMYIEFFAQSWGGWTTIEQFNVLVSTTDMNPSSFSCISGENPINAPIGEWTRFVYDLNPYKDQEVYVAIQCVTSWGLVFLIDDIAFKVKTNALPEFTSTPVLNVVKGKQYAYSVAFADNDVEDILSISAKTELPSWLQLNQANNASAQLIGTPSEAGSFPITLIISDGKGQTEQSFTITVSNDNTSVGDMELKSIRIFPSLFREGFTIENANGTKYTVVNVLGQVVVQGAITSDSFSVNASDWNNGIYLVKMQNVRSSLVIRVVKK